MKKRMALAILLFQYVQKVPVEII